MLKKRVFLYAVRELVTIKLFVVGDGERWLCGERACPLNGVESKKGGKKICRRCYTFIVSFSIIYIERDRERESDA